MKKTIFVWILLVSAALLHNGHTHAMSPFSSQFPFPGIHAPMYWLRTSIEERVARQRRLSSMSQPTHEISAKTEKVPKKTLQ